MQWGMPSETVVSFVCQDLHDIKAEMINSIFLSIVTSFLRSRVLSYLCLPGSLCLVPDLTGSKYKVPSSCTVSDSFSHCLLEALVMEFRCRRDLAPWTV